MNEQLKTSKRQPKLKVCGLTKLHQINELISLNTDFLGFIFYEKSPRYVLNALTLAEIKSINHQGKVGVFVNESIDKIVAISDQAGLSYVQLHGDEEDCFISELRSKLNQKTEIIKVIRIGNQNFTKLQETVNHQPSTINYLLFDTDSKSFGGTGKCFDWQILNELEIPIPYFLSGGISEEYIDNLRLLKQQPFALDINSKFEIEPGNKDVEKIVKFKNTLSREATS